MEKKPSISIINNLILKWAKCLNRHLRKHKMVKKHEGPQPYWSPGKCKLKQQLDPSNSPITVTKIKKPDNIKDQSTCGPTETLKRC